MKVWDAAGVVDGPETLSFDAAEFALPQLGFIVENLLVQHALLNCLAASAADLRFATPWPTWRAQCPGHGATCNASQCPT